MNSPIRLIAIDLDGTLFTSQQQVSPASRAALRQALDAGIQIVLASGRGISGVERTLDLLEMDLPYISSAGAAIFPGKQGQVISARTFHVRAELDLVIDFARQTGAGLVADLPRGMLWYGPDDLLDRLDAFTAASMRNSLRTVDPVKDFDQPIFKMSLAGGPGLLNDAAEVLAKCPSLHSIYAGIQYVDITARGVDKGSALRIFAGQAGMAPAEIAAIGDQPIDLPMFEYAGLAIAMGNAPAAVQQAANWVAPSNDEDGLAWSLTRILAQT